MESVPFLADVVARWSSDVHHNVKQIDVPLNVSSYNCGFASEFEIDSGVPLENVQIAVAHSLGPNLVDRDFPSNHCMARHDSSPYSLLNGLCSHLDRSSICLV